MFLRQAPHISESYAWNKDWGQTFYELLPKITTQKLSSFNTKQMHCFSVYCGDLYFLTSKETGQLKYTLQKYTVSYLTQVPLGFFT